LLGYWHFSSFCARPVELALKGAFGAHDEDLLGTITVYLEQLHLGNARVVQLLDRQQPAPKFG
jgi:hypothetical protein